MSGALLSRVREIFKCIGDRSRGSRARDLHGIGLVSTIADEPTCRHTLRATVMYSQNRFIVASASGSGGEEAVHDGDNRDFSAT
jgi:hypothetical protein